MGFEVHFSQDDWLRVQTAWKSWWNGTLDYPMVTLEANDDPHKNWIKALNEITHVTTPSGVVDQIISDQEVIFENLRWFGSAFPKFFINYGPGVVAAFLGSTLNIVPGTTWFEALGVNSLAEIKLDALPESSWWRLIRELSKESAQRWRGKVAVGHTDLGGNLDILASLRGTQPLLTDLVDDPIKVERLIRQITQYWLDYYDALFDLIQPVGMGCCGWSPLWAPGRLYMLQSDFSYMISNRMFQRFVMPDLQACCESLDYAFYHLDGPGEIRHLDSLLAIPRLRGIQWIPGAGQPSAEDWPDILKRIRQGNKLCQVYVGREGAFKILKEIGWKGFCFAISEDEPLTSQEAAEFIKEFYRAASLIG